VTIEGTAAVFKFDVIYSKYICPGGASRSMKVFSKDVGVTIKLVPTLSNHEMRIDVKTDLDERGGLTEEQKFLADVISLGTLSFINLRAEYSVRMDEILKKLRDLQKPVFQELFKVDQSFRQFGFKEGSPSFILEAAQPHGMLELRQPLSFQIPGAIACKTYFDILDHYKMIRGGR
jgi:hypothetical protein